MKLSKVAIMCIILMSFAIGFVLYPSMPDYMASHWNIRGEVNGYFSKFWGLFLMPIISLVIFLVFSTLPKIDPLKRNIKDFEKYFNQFVFVLVAFLFYVYLLTIFWNFSFNFVMIQLLAPAFAILFYYIGILCEKAKRNWFVGIRTPWTLSNDHVWDKTHQLAGILFKTAGIVSLLSLPFPNYALFMILVPAIAFSIVLFIYSYVEFRKIEKRL